MEPPKWDDDQRNALEDVKEKKLKLPFNSYENMKLAGYEGYCARLLRMYPDMSRMQANHHFVDSANHLVKKWQPRNSANHGAWTEDKKQTDKEMFLLSAETDNGHQKFWEEMEEKYIGIDITYVTENIYARAAAAGTNFNAIGYANAETEFSGVNIHKYLNSNGGDVAADSFVRGPGEEPNPYADNANATQLNPNSWKASRPELARRDLAEEEEDRYIFDCEDSDGYDGGVSDVGDGDEDEGGDADVEDNEGDNDCYDPDEDDEDRNNPLYYTDVFDPEEVAVPESVAISSRDEFNNPFMNFSDVDSSDCNREIKGYYYNADKVAEVNRKMKLVRQEARMAEKAEKAAKAAKKALNRRKRGFKGVDDRATKKARVHAPQHGVDFAIPYHCK